MRQNTKKFRPNPSKTLRHSIRSSSIRDIIGDRRFDHQFSHVNPHRTEGAKKVKRMKVDDAEADDLPNLGQNASSSQSEAAEDPIRCCGDFAAKTSEYAFFKRMKQTTTSNTHIHPKYHDNQLNNAQQSDHSTKEEIPNVQKESIKCTRPSFTVEKEQDDAHYAFLTPVYRSKNSEVSDVLGVDDTNVQSWLSPSMGRKAKMSGSKGVFSMKREKLHRLVADKSLYDVNELSLKGIDLVSDLISRILPEKQEKNCKDETKSKYKLPSFSELEAATLINGHEANKRTFIESHHTSYLDDDFPRSSKRLTDTDLLEWNPNHSESFYIGHAPKSSIQYDCYHSEAYKRNWIKSHHISYEDDGFQRSDMDLREWNPNGSESCFTVDDPKSCFKYNHYDSEPYERKFIKSQHMSYLDDSFPRSSERVTDMDRVEQDPSDSESFPKSNYSIWYNHWHTEDGFRIPNYKDLEEYHFDNEPKLLEHPQPLLLGWENNSEKDEFQAEINTFSTPSTSQDDDYQLYMPIDGHLKEDHFMSSSIIPYTPKHDMPVEDCSINNHTWCLDESLHEKEESFRFLLQSPDKDFKSFLHSSDKKEKNFMCSSSPGDLLEGRVKSYSYMEGFDDNDFDHIGYPLLLHDSYENES